MGHRQKRLSALPKVWSKSEGRERELEWRPPGVRQSLYSSHSVWPLLDGVVAAFKECLSGAVGSRSTLETIELS